MILVINLDHFGCCKERLSGGEFAFDDVDGRDVMMLRVCRLPVLEGVDRAAVYDILRASALVTPYTAEDNVAGGLYDPEQHLSSDPPWPCS